MKHRAVKRMLSGCLSAALILQAAAVVPAFAEYAAQKVQLDRR